MVGLPSRTVVVVVVGARSSCCVAACPAPTTAMRSPPTCARAYITLVSYTHTHTTLLIFGLNKFLKKIKE